MKATVTKSGKKPGSQAVVAAPRKTGATKAAASAPAKKITGAPKPASKAKTAAAKSTPAVKKAAAKPVAKAAPPKAALKAVKAAPKAPAGKTAAPAAKALKAVAATAAKPAAKAQPEAALKKTVQQAVKAGETGVRSNTVSAELADKMKTSVVSKVSEVMTKTTKPAPALNTEGRIISEDEIRAMGEKDYMNPAQLAFFKARLQQLEKDLLKNAGETTEHLRETVLVPDPADRATIEEEHALELRTRDRERKLLKKVQQSIASIDSGEYGWCEETGEPIGVPRLLARPTATLSLEAQQRREIKQKLYGD
jgi:DnaK suppressor protein